MFAGLLIYYQFLEDDLILGILISCIWIPQIIHNIKNSTSLAPSYLFIFSNSILQIFPCLYFKSYPSNFLEKKPSTCFAFEVFLLMVLQLFIMCYQKVFGSRSLLPRFLRPNNYSYIRSMATNLEIEMGDPKMHPLKDLDCAICLIPIIKSVDGISDEKSYFETPCSHKFHEFCLRTWIIQKRECPSCRSPLPPLEDIE